MARAKGDKQKKGAPTAKGGVPVNERGFTEQQEKFCHLYAYGPHRGNGVQCYAAAYMVDLSDKSGYMNAKNGAWRLLTHADILAYIRALYETEGGLNDTAVDNELAFVIQQNADFNSKVQAIKEYNQLKNRIIKKEENNPGNVTINITKGGTIIKNV